MVEQVPDDAEKEQPAPIGAGQNRVALPAAQPQRDQEDRRRQQQPESVKRNLRKIPQRELDDGEVGAPDGDHQEQEGVQQQGRVQFGTCPNEELRTKN